MKNILISIFLLPQKALLYGICGINLLLTHPIKLLTKGIDDARETYNWDIYKGNIYSTTIAWLTLFPLVSAILFPINTLHNIIAWKKGIEQYCKQHTIDEGDYIFYKYQNISQAMIGTQDCEVVYCQMVKKEEQVEQYNLYEPTLSNGFRMLFGNEPKYSKRNCILPNIVKIIN